MTTDIRLYDYELPPDLIAQSPATPRESAKLMNVDRKTGSISHLHVADLPSLLIPNDVLVVNNTKVFKARLFAVYTDGNGAKKPIEIFLIRPVDQSNWIALGKPGKKCIPGGIFEIAPDFHATVIARHDDGTLTITFCLPVDDVIRKANEYGHVPIPPYIKGEPNADSYQTSYAKITGSVAAPTAGFHLTPALLETIQAKGVTILEITLHVGLGTFLPVKSADLESHHMHAEYASITKTVADAIMKAKHDRKRIIAVGTTTVRTLEGVASLSNGEIREFQGDISLFIKPGFHFRIVDAMLTNFHLPKSTLLVLVSTFAGYEFIRNAYRQAVDREYRFYSFGDAMFIG